ncbi:hypothetical protein NFI96_004110 [Prochilodus magdalenae]|nr:hypothetical protein NFI96_004110 [Prochilodus magdalenae]
MSMMEGRETPMILSAFLTIHLAFETPSYDPCNNYTTLDQPWRGTNETGLGICDYNFNWTGWYRMMYYGMNIRMPESCVNESRCGTYTTLWLNGSHPQIQDGIVTRGVCMNVGWEECCYYKSIPIRVKACPGDYYVYEFVRPADYCSAYCADTTNVDFDPCNVYSVLDNDWRRTDTRSHNYYYYEHYYSYDDTLVEWNGWYRLYLQGKSAQIPESDWCWGFMTCGGYTVLFLGGPHPQLQDGIVTREIYGSYDSYYSRQCNFYRSNPIQVKACPGNYYVYRLVKPVVSLPMPTYCADTTNVDFDPCSVYTVLDNDWRRTETRSHYYYNGYDDTLVEWSGWYRLYLQGKSAQIPESDWCWSNVTCGGYTALSLGGPHPLLQDGIVIRDIYGSYDSYYSTQCNFYRSNLIKVKACPGNYYVYRLVKPAPSFPMPTYCAVPVITNFTISGKNTSSVSLTWNSPQRNSYFYRVMWTDGTVSSNATTTSTSYTVTDLTPGVRYIFRVTAFAADGVTKGASVQISTFTNYFVILCVVVGVCVIAASIAVFVWKSYDPCIIYTFLDQPWRGTNAAGGWNCDNYFNWNDWYRLLYNGMNIRMPESCVNEYRCGTHITLWLNGSHPQIEDGIVTRGVCGRME